MLNDPVALRLTGRLDLAALRAALTTVLARHPVLATSFVVRDGVAALAVDGDTTPDFSVVDVPSGADLVSLVNVEAAGMSPACRSLVRVRLLRVSDTDHVLVLVTHRLVCDGPSVTLLASELAGAYTAVATGRPAEPAEPAVSHADYARWQWAWLRSPAGQRELAHHQQRLAGLVPAELPTDRPRSPARAGHAGQVVRRVGGPPPPTASLTPVLATALAVVLGRHSRQDDIALGVGTRPRAPGLGRSVGPFEDPVVLRLDLSDNPDLADLLGRVRAGLDTTEAHPPVPFAALAERLGGPEPGRHPVFQVALAVRDGVDMRLPGLRVEPLGLPAGDTAGGQATGPTPDPAGPALALGLDLSVTAVRAGDRLELRLSYAEDLFDRWRVERLTDHLIRAARAVHDEPDRRLWQVDLLDEAERGRLLSGWQGPSRAHPHTPVHRQVAAQAARTPEATALVDATSQLNYRDLDLRSNRLANHLRSLGVGPGVLVGVFLPRDVELVVTLLAILKAGGAYVPLDLNYPAGRITMILADSGAGLVLTRSTLRARLPDTGPATVVALDTHEPMVASAGDRMPDTGWDPHRVCHVVFTSGSTGRPKGVAASHGNVASYLSGLLATVEADRFTRVLFSTAASFDACLVELWPPLLVGGTLVVADNLLLVSDQADRHDEVTLVNTVPSVLAEYLRLGSLPRGLRTLTVGAEPLPRRLVDRVFAESAVEEIYNMYGPTETTAYVTMRRITRGDTAVTIGRPLDNVRAYILDRVGSPTPVGVPGELHLGGPGVALGYLNRPGLTAGRFVPDHLGGQPGGRLYRTGDLARWTPTGEIDFSGRVDNQVKLRGFRIELGEIEATLARHPGVAGAVVALRSDPAGEPQLVGYVVATGQPPSAAELATSCRATLPPYMTPAAFAVIGAIPLSHTGKVDRRALPEPDWPGRGPGRRSGPTAPEELPDLPGLSTLVDLCADLPDLPDQAGSRGVGRDGRGGRWEPSLRLVHRARSALGVSLGVWSVYQAPTVAALSRVVADAVRAATEPGEPGQPDPAIAGHPREEDSGCG